MKTKFLLPALVGLTLAACTAEEDFYQNSEIKQSPITFTVEKDDAALGSRATLSGSVVNFNTGDLISLYHNSTLASGNAGDVKAGQNAIFEGHGLDGSLVFTTKSMVLNGSAVMVYPADTSFVNTTGQAITISVPTTQDADTKLFQPYMSEAFTIGAYDGTKGEDNTAGYGRNYTVPLKKVGSLLTMNLTAENLNMINNIEGVDDVIIESVEINAGADKNIFANTVKVTTVNTTPVLALDSDDENAAANSDDEKFAHMKYVSEVATTASVNTIKTSDLSNGKAYFTLLPQTTAADATATSITVYTSYGKVVVETSALDNNNKATYPLVKSGETVHKNLAAAVNDIINNAWGANTSSANFKGEKTGASFTRTFTFDMKNLDMNGATVKTSKQLIDLLKVYEALEIEEEVVWTLDGENNYFQMTGDALDKLIAVNTNGKIKLDKGNSQIVLSDKNATIAKFQNDNVVVGQLLPINNVTTFVEMGVDIRLGAGVEWTIDQTLTSKHIAFMNNDGTLTVTNNQSMTSPLAVKLTNATGVMKLGSSTVVLGSFINISDLNVAANQTLYFAGETSLYGTVENKGIISANGGAVVNYGYIDNQFEVSVVYEGTTANGSFTNAGRIYNNGNSAVTYITANEYTTYKGVITLTNRNDEVSINESNAPGYVKYTLKSTEANYVPEMNDKFNWLIIDKTATVKLASVNSNNGEAEAVDYLEIKGNPTNIECTNFTVIDLFVEGSMRLLDGNSLAATNVYVKNYILRAAGALTGTQQTSYTGKTYGDSATAVSYPGVIRTAASNN